MKLTAKVKYIVARAKKWLKDVVKLPTKTQLIAIGKKNKLAITSLQAEQAIDALKIVRYEQSLKVPKAAPAAPLAKKGEAAANGKKFENKVEDSNLHPKDQEPVMKTETPVQAQQQQPKQSRTYGFRR